MVLRWEKKITVVPDWNLNFLPSGSFHLHQISPVPFQRSCICIRKCLVNLLAKQPQYLLSLQWFYSPVEFPDKFYLLLNWADCCLSVFQIWKKEASCSKAMFVKYICSSLGSGRLEEKCVNGPSLLKTVSKQCFTLTGIMFLFFSCSSFTHSAAQVSHR